MVGTGAFVAMGDGAEFAHEQRAVRSQMVQPPAGIFTKHFKMFRCVSVADFNHFLPAAANDDFRIIIP